MAKKSKKSIKSAPMTKYERLVELSAHVIKFDVLKGHLKWKVTDIARASKTSRSRIYEVLGRNKNEILLNALAFLLDDLYGKTPERKELHRTHGPFEGVIRSRRIVLAYPELVAFSYRNRLRNDRIGELLKNSEKDYWDLLSDQTGVKDPDKLLFMRTMIHGISQAPFITDEQVKELLTAVGKYPTLKA